jgi:hypothetical protein
MPTATAAMKLKTRAGGSPALGPVPISTPVRAPQLGQILALAWIWAPQVLHLTIGPVLSA